MINNDAVLVIDAATNIAVTTVSVGDGPWGSAVTPDGAKLYVSNTNSGTVSVVSTASNSVVGTIPVGTFPISRGKFIEPQFTTTTSSTTSTTLPPTDLIPGRIGIVKPGALAKFVAKPITGDTFVLPSANPIAEGGSLNIFDISSTAGDDSYVLPLGNGWKGLGTPAGSKGYKYNGAGTPGDPCKVVLVKEKVIKGVCKGTGVTLVPPFDGDVGIVLSLGTTDRYCARLGGDEVKNDSTLTKRKNAPAPAACPSVPTTSSSVTTTTSTSTTSTTLMSGCFVDAGDGTIHDTCTGLRWEKKSYLFGLHYVENRYTWAGCCNGSCGTTSDLCQPTAGASVLCAANSDGGTQGCSTCSSGTCVVDPAGHGAITTVWEWLNQLNGANFAGYNDWRLPSEGGHNAPPTGTNELETILSSPCGGAPCISSIFGPTSSLYYWSASTYTPNEFMAWRVYFGAGGASFDEKRLASDRYVRAVRDE
jgi:YVTN family beta-propeller protein